MRAWLFLIITAGYLYVPIKESIHIFQQNRYQLERYHMWLKEEINVKQKQWVKTGGFLLMMLALLLVPSQHHPYELMMILLVIYGYLFYRADLQKSYIQKLALTHRAKRLCVIHVGLCLFSIKILYSICSFPVLLCCMPFVYALPWFVLYGSAMITAPLENAIKESYVKDASNILSSRTDLIRIGITGSYGKTSVKNILHALVSEEYYAYMTPHSYNNLMGLTLSIRTQLTSLHQIFIAEMGADHVGEIDRLAKFIHPTLAIVTAVGPQHLSTFGTQDHILKEKMRLVENLPFHGIAVLNYDNELIRTYQIEHPCTVIRYGIHYEDVDVRAINIRYSKSGSRFTVVMKHQSFEVETILLGEHNVLNILAAICVADALHIPCAEICSALKRLRYVEHRLEIRNMGLYHLLDDAYNSNPEGARYALEVLKQMDGHRFLLTPGFLDLGDEKQMAHYTYAKQMMDCADEIILIGPTQTRDIYDALCKEGYPLDHVHMTSSTKEAFAILHKLVKKGDTALIENDLPDAFNH